VSAYCDAANAGSNGVLRSVGFDLARAFDGDIFAPGETGCVRVFQRTGPIANEH
jgi:RimJ/RimL family protein N-acetyltransferase